MMFETYKNFDAKLADYNMPWYVRIFKHWNWAYHKLGQWVLDRRLWRAFWNTTVRRFDNSIVNNIKGVKPLEESEEQIYYKGISE